MESSSRWNIEKAKVKQNQTWSLKASWSTCNALWDETSLSCFRVKLRAESDILFLRRIFSCYWTKDIEHWTQDKWQRELDIGQRSWDMRHSDHSSFVCLVCLFVGWFICWIIYWFIHLLVCSFVGLLVCWFVYLLVHSFVGLFICWLLVHSFVSSLFVSSFICWSVRLLVCWFFCLLVCLYSVINNEGVKNNC